MRMIPIFFWVSSEHFIYLAFDITFAFVVMGDKCIFIGTFCTWRIWKDKISSLILSISYSVSVRVWPIVGWKLDLLLGIFITILRKFIMSIRAILGVIAATVTASATTNTIWTRSSRWAARAIISTRATTTTTTTWWTARATISTRATAATWWAIRVSIFIRTITTATTTWRRTIGLVSMSRTFLNASSSGTRGLFRILSTNISSTKWSASRRRNRIRCCKSFD